MNASRSRQDKPGRDKPARNKSGRNNSDPGDRGSENTARARSPKKPDNGSLVEDDSQAVIAPVVSAAHLAQGAMPALSELEFALTIANNGFSRWMIRCAAAADLPGLTPLEILVLHSVNHRNREKTLADLCLVLNVEDTHIVAYALKKLARAGMVETGRRGKEKTVAISPEGADFCARYRSLREALLVRTVKALSLDEADLSRLAALLRGLSGTYDQAARAAAAQ